MNFPACVLVVDVDVANNHELSSCLIAVVEIKTFAQDFLAFTKKLLSLDTGYISRAAWGFRFPRMLPPLFR